MLDKLFLVTLNFEGEIHNLHTHARTEFGAMLNATVRLGKKLDISSYKMRQYFLTGKDNVIIKEVQNDLM